MDDKEWQNVQVNMAQSKYSAMHPCVHTNVRIQGFLRKVYSAGDDMTALANGFDKEGQNKVISWTRDSK